jgi:hypothetical protein
MQGYCVGPPKNAAPCTINNRSAQELTAISWAAFCTDMSPEQDTTYRLQALDCDNLFQRLQLALRMLSIKKKMLKKRVEKAGLRNIDEIRRSDTDLNDTNNTQGDAFDKR